VKQRPKREIFFGCLVATVVASAFAIASWRSLPFRRPADSMRPDLRRPVADEIPPPATGALPVLWQVPPFSFVDQHGRSTTAEDLRGHVWIADFVFTRCTTICPLITAKMALLQRRLQSSDLRFVSFSVDPEHDTPEALKRYAAGWRAGESRWILLSTTPAALASLASGMYVSVKPGENDILHTNLFFLVDEQGRVRGIYESDKDDALERLARDTAELARESPASPRDEATSGGELYAALGCGACHSRHDLAPPLEGLLGRRVQLVGRAELTADAGYVRESILVPSAKIVAGYSIQMPSYERELTTGELDRIVEYVGTLGANQPARSRQLSPASAQVITDPVCSMEVRKTETTPRATHAGHTYHFCSELCRDRFVADPARYAKTTKAERR
jgi:protein SCO1/2